MAACPIDVYKRQGDKRPLRIIGNGIFIRRDVNVVQAALQFLAGDVEISHVSQHQMVELCIRDSYVICDRENHASIYDGCKLSYGTMLRYRHNDMADLEKKLQKVPEESGCLIVTDGVFSMGGDIANLPEIVRLAQKYGARVMVDDAHGLGVIGEGGRGTASYFGLEDPVSYTHLDVYKRQG